ncbi:MAG TPA: hypothetical protein VFA75_05255 [Nevskia sp.]|nr:hypothetical protein [Nevskia sp.]
MGNPTTDNRQADLLERLRKAAASSNTPELLNEAAAVIEDLLEGMVQIEMDPRPIGD